MNYAPKSRLSFPYVANEIIDIFLIVKIGLYKISTQIPQSFNILSFSAIMIAETRLARRVFAPALILTAVRESEPPEGIAWKNPPMILASPWAMKSRFALGCEPSASGTVCVIPAL